jgi:hypothetical protein
MRISEERYDRDIRRIDLAHRLIRHETRTQWICRWTGLTEKRVRNLSRSYRAGQGNVDRHRGPPPQKISKVLRSPALRSEASALAGLLVALEVLPRERAPDARTMLPGIDLGERVCRVFELYKEMVPGALFTMDLFILLLLELAQSDHLEVIHCAHCHGAILIDRLGSTRHLCVWCQQALRQQSPDVLWAPDRSCDSTGVVSSQEGFQHSLF